MGCSELDESNGGRKGGGMVKEWNIGYWNAGIMGGNFGIWEL